MSLPINIPGRIVKDQAVTALWANSVREAIARLASRKEPRRGGGGGGGASLPFQIVADTVSAAPVIRVSDGMFTVQSWFTETNTIECNADEESVLIGGGSLGTESTDGYLSVSVSTTYGVFIVAETAAQSRTPFANGTGYPGTMGIYDPIVVISSSNNTAASLNAMTSSGTYAGYCGWFLGQVVVDGSGNVAITQHRRSDITVVEPVWIYQTIASADASNSITAGSDGGAYYDEP